jgi:sensor histidine kinase YesM
MLGWFISVLPFLHFTDKFALFFTISIFFIIAIPVQLQYQRKWMIESHNTHTWERHPLKQYGLSFYYAFLFGSVQGILISLIGFVFFKEIVAYRIFYPIAFSATIFQALLLTFWIQMRYLLRQRKFLKKETQSFDYLGKLAQKKALQDLVSPHFLFNSLNTAASIIPDDHKTGLKFVTELGDLYTFILKNNENKLITLSEEIEIVEKYNFLVQTRFGEFFEIKMDIPPQYQTALIPPLGLQNLVENAAKHNAVTRKKPLLLEISIEGEYIEIRNNINPKKTFSDESTNLGLDYIQSQIQQYSKLKMTIDIDENFFIVKIPLIYPSSIQ